MKKQNERTIYEWYVVVEGRGDFPIDMLRYDSAYPLEQTDSSRIGERGPRRVALVRRGVNGGSGNAARWRSFGWVVVGAFEGFDPGPAKELRDAPVPVSTMHSAPRDSDG